MDGGHYVAYIRKNLGNQITASPIVAKEWYYFSDNDYSDVPLDQVLSSEAYILFYEKQTQ